MEILPSARCWLILVKGFISTRTIRKSRCFARVFELRPVSRSQESLLRRSWSSADRSNLNIGLANHGNLFRLSLFPPVLETLAIVAIVIDPFLVGRDNDRTSLSKENRLDANPHI